VHLALAFDWQTRPLYDVIARIPGAADPDQWVIYGNHHDAWVNGAQDPLSGQIALLETARALGTLRKTGWRPARTIVLAAWDGEEWGLLGSTEWAEKHERELHDKGVVYINSDVNDRGWLTADGSHSLATFVTEVARDVRDPRTGKSVLDAALQHKREERAKAASPAAQPAPSQATRPDSANPARRDTTLTPRAAATAGAAGIPSAGDSTRAGVARSESARTDSAAARDTFTIGALGSGSDYTAALDHLAMPALNVAYGGDTHAGIYHSIYDSYDFFVRFLDTNFVYGVAEAQTTATALLRLADAPLLPFEFGTAARTYRGYVDEIEKAARKNDTTKALDLAAVRRAVDRLERAAARYEAAQRAAAGLSSAALARRRAALSGVNRTLFMTERDLSDPRGLPGREWFRHLIYAPGYYTGYGVKTMPGIREAVEDRPNLAVAQREAARVAEAIERMAARVDAAAEGLEKVAR
jgi:N-acetylated-alpha-linked acidic dipeptidase